MDTLYLDNAATSFPKAPGLGDWMKDYFDTLSVNINRSTYQSCTDAANIVLSTRELLCTLFHFDDPSHVIFTPGITYSLNYIIKGSLHSGDHCLISSFEHNAVVRPLCQLEKQGVQYDLIDCDSEGNFSVEDLQSKIKPNTKLVVLTHASNVFGNILPIAEISKLLKSYDIPLVLDTAQTAGHVPIDFSALGLSALCFTGHKGLLGSSGIGGMLLAHDFAKKLTPLVAGGTGSASHLLELPPYMPDRFESGTLNIAGIFSLYHSLSFLMHTGIEVMHAKEMQLTQQFIDGIQHVPHVKIIGDWPLSQRVSTLSIQLVDADHAEAAYTLEQDFGILTRCGLHCSPLAHQSLCTYPEGTIRFSFGYFNTPEEVDVAIQALKTLTT